MRIPKQKKSYHFLRGFTLIEIIITIAIAAILTSLAIPSFTTLIANTRIENKANELYGLLKQTRQNAIVTNNWSFVCRTIRAVNNVNSNGAACRTPAGTAAGDWSIELMSYTALTDTNVPNPNATFNNLKIQRLEGDNARKKQMLQVVREEAMDSLNIVSGVNNNVIAFNSSGALVNNAPFRFAVCDDRIPAEDFGRIVEINQSGQIRLYKTLDTTVDTNKDCTPT